MQNKIELFFPLLLIVFSITYVESYNLKFSIISYSLSGKDCITDCDESGLCWVSHKKQEHCNPGFERAPTYFTSRDRTSYSECRSKCVYDGESYSWCYINDDSHWDYCSTETKAVGNWYEYTKSYGRCFTACGKRGQDYTWCDTFWEDPNWDYCDEDTYYYEETATTIYGKQCYGNCKPHDNTYYWCYDETQSKEKCAPTALPHACRKPRRSNELSDKLDDGKNLTNCNIEDSKNSTRVRRAVPPRRTVAEYNQDIDDMVANDPNVHTNTLSSPNQPILDYTYRDYNGIRLPLRVRAIIRPNHINPIPRKGRGVSSGARKNCNAMGMNKCMPNGNNDQCGHMIPYILSGSDQWFNLVPQTRRVNGGTSERYDLRYPSVWAVTERSIRRVVESGGHVEFNVVITYDLPVTRPTGFGVTERYFNGRGGLDFECLGFWYSNDPYQDPDEWNFG